MSTGTKSKSKSVSFEPDLWDRVEAKASADFGGNRSAYLRELVLADLTGEFSPDNPSVLVDLVAKFHPTLAASFRASLRTADQPRVLMRLLEALDHAIEGAAAETPGGHEAGGTASEVLVSLKRAALESRRTAAMPAVLVEPGGALGEREIERARARLSAAASASNSAPGKRRANREKTPEGQT